MIRLPSIASKRTWAAGVALMAAALLSSCGEFDQSMSSANTNRKDVEAWKGAKNPYVAQGWAAGDKTAWENQLRNRSQYQNEYVKTN
jgi:hypothetical protein